MADGVIYGSYSDDGRRWRFGWSSSIASPGKTTVRWTLSVETGYSGQWTYGSCSFSVSGSSYSTGGRVQVYSGEKASGSFTINHDNSGAGSFWVNFVESMYTMTEYNHSQTIALPQNNPYTACGAPTSVTISPAYVIPGGTVTIKWSGAKNGTNNKITQYRISFNNTTKIILSTSTSGSITMKAPTTRGNTYTAKVRTEGTAGNSYYSSYKTSSNKIQINRLPSTPTMVSNTKVFATTASEADRTVNITPGKDNDSQTISVWVSTDTSSPKTKCINNQYICNLPTTQGASETIYFWSYDGLEYSANPYAFTYYKNKIEQTTLNQNITNVEVYKGAADILYITKLTNSINIDQSTMLNDISHTFTYKWYYTIINSTTDELIPIQCNQNTCVLGEHYTIPENNSFQISVIVNDGYEDYNIKTSSMYRIPSFPGTTISNLTSTVDDASSKFYNYAEFQYIANDENGKRKIKDITGIFTVNDRIITGSKLPTSTQKIYHNSLSTTERCQPGDQLYAGLQLKDSLGNIHTSIDQTSFLTRVNNMSWVQVPATISINPFKMRDEIATFNLSINNTIYDGVGTQYTQYSKEWFKWTLDFIDNNTPKIQFEDTILDFTKQPETQPIGKWINESDGTKLILIIANGDIRDKFLNEEYTKNNKIINNIFKLTVKDRFGQSLSYSFPITIDYRMPPTWTIDNIKCSTHTAESGPYWNIESYVSTSRNSIESRFLNINDTLYLTTPKFTDANYTIASNYRMVIEECIRPCEGSDVWNPTAESIPGEFTKPTNTIIQLTNNDLGADSAQLIGELGKTREYHIPIKQSTHTTLKNYWCLFRVKIVDPDGLESGWKYFEYALLKSDNPIPTLNINNITASLNSNKTYTLTFTNVFNQLTGFNFTVNQIQYSNYTRSIAFNPTSDKKPEAVFEYKFQNGEAWKRIEPTWYASFGQNTTYDYLNNTSQQISNFDMEQNSFVICRLIITLPIAENNNLIFTSNEYILFIESPLVSYQAGQIGINTENVKQNIVTITSMQNNISTISLFTTSHEATIDLNTGNINSFVIDGGTWNT